MNKIVFVDVDDTLVRTSGSKRIPIPNVISGIRALFLDGCELYCWSSGGAEYAEESARELGIHDCFASFLPKPHIMLDDQSPLDWSNLSILHPNEIDSLVGESDD